MQPADGPDGTSRTDRIEAAGRWLYCALAGLDRGWRASVAGGLVVAAAALL